MTISLGGRLTLTSGVAVTESDVTGAATVYFTPAGNGFDLTQIYDGAVFQERQFTETTLTLNNTNHLASKTYPVYVAWVSSAFFLGTGPAWSGNAPGGTDFTLIRGISTNNGSITLKNGATSNSISTNQATYVGAIGITTVAGLTEDSAVNRLVGNVYNSVPRSMIRREVTANWNYSTATYRAANNNTANAITYVQPVSGRRTFARTQSVVENSTTTNRLVSTGIGIDSTSIDSSTLMCFGSVINVLAPIYSEYDGFPGVGRHTLTWLECGNGTDTQTWIGTPVQNAASSATNYAPGIHGWTEL